MSKVFVSVVGLGVGNPDYLTIGGKKAIENADCLIGAKRMVEELGLGKPYFLSLKPEEIAKIIDTHPEYQNFCVVMSGDTGFYSGTKKLLPYLSHCETKVYPGISSIQYLCAALGTSWEDVHITSLHGRSGALSTLVAQYPKVFSLVGGENAINHICQELCDAGFGEVAVTVGERLSYPDEKITTATPKKLLNGKFNSLSVVLVQQENFVPLAYRGNIPDNAFIRQMGEKGTVPMTKSEVRAISVGKLQLTSDAIVYDIGAGTGSVAIEMAHCSPNGHVYAIECKEKAVALIEENKKKFGVHHLTVVSGMAPEACAELPPPTHAFIGGTMGNMEEILDMLWAKNPDVRIVANFVTLESVGEMVNILKKRDIVGEIVQVNVARSRMVGSYHLMTAENPITIFTL